MFLTWIIKLKDRSTCVFRGVLCILHESKEEALLLAKCFQLLYIMPRDKKNELDFNIEVQSPCIISPYHRHTICTAVLC